MSVRKIAVVTGGAGFIGSHMADRLLDEGFRVHVIDNLVGGRLENLAHRQGDPNLVVETRDILNLAPDDKLFAGAEYVFHFAGIGDIESQTRQVCENLKAAVEVVARAVVSDGTIRFVRLVAGGVAVVPVRLSAVEKALEGGPATPAAILDAAGHCAEGAKLLPATAYKVDLLKGLVRDLMEALVR